MNEFIVKIGLVLLAIFIAIVLVLDQDPESGSLRSGQTKVVNKMIDEQEKYSDR